MQNKMQRTSQLGKLLAGAAILTTSWVHFTGRLLLKHTIFPLHTWGGLWVFTRNFYNHANHRTNAQTNPSDRMLYGDMRCNVTWCWWSRPGEEDEALNAVIQKQCNLVGRAIRGVQSHLPWIQSDRTFRSRAAPSSSKSSDVVKVDAIANRIVPHGFTFRTTNDTWRTWQLNCRLGIYLQMHGSRYPVARLAHDSERNCARYLLRLHLKRAQMSPGGAVTGSEFHPSWCGREVVLIFTNSVKQSESFNIRMSSRRGRFAADPVLFS